MSIFFPIGDGIFLKDPGICARACWQVEAWDLGHDSTGWCFDFSPTFKDIQKISYFSPQFSSILARNALTGPLVMDPVS